MNIGMFELQQQALEGLLMDAQQEAMRNLCERSAAMLREHGMSSEPWLDIVQDHHERPDDSGYPAGKPAMRLACCPSCCHRRTFIWCDSVVDARKLHCF